MRRGDSHVHEYRSVANGAACVYTLEEVQALIDELWLVLRAQAQQIEDLTYQIQERDRQITGTAEAFGRIDYRNLHACIESWRARCHLSDR